MTTGTALIRLAFIVSAFFLSSATSVAFSQTEYPNKPIRFLVGFVPGGTTDMLARVIGQAVGTNLRQQVVIDNRPGANGNLAAKLAATAAPDGYTMMMVPSSFVISPAIYQNLPFDAIRDFSAITTVANVSNVLVVHPSIRAKSVKELIVLSRNKPRQLSYGSAGTGSPGHLSAELFRMIAGVDYVHVPYKGGGQGMIALLGGEVQLSFPSIPACIQYIRSGKLVALGVTSKQRSPTLPDVPTIAESGVEGYEVSGWFGLLGPAGIRHRIVVTLNEQINRVLQAAELREVLLRQGAEPLGSSPQEFASIISGDLGKWARVAAAAGIKGQ